MSVTANFSVTADVLARLFHLSGELDVSTVDALMAVVEPVLADPGDVQLDLAGLAFMDSTGIKALLALSRQLGDRGRLILLAPGNAVRRILELTRLDARAECFDIRDTAETVGESDERARQSQRAQPDPAVPPSAGS
jgi:anti-anti-sigma factor